MKTRVWGISILVFAAIVLVGGWRVFSMKAASLRKEPVQQKEQSQTQPKEPDVVDEILSDQFGDPKSMIGIMGIPGFVIGDVVPGSPADRAGLKRGDILTTVDGKQVNSIKDVLRISRREPGQSVKIAFLRHNLTTNENDRYETALITVPFQVPPPPISLVKVAFAMVVCCINGRQYRRNASNMASQRLNTYQKATLLIGVALTVFTCLFPPWIYNLQGEINNAPLDRNAGYGFIFAPPPSIDLAPFSASMVAKVNIFQVFIQLVSIVLLTAGFFFFLRPKPRQ